MAAMNHLGYELLSCLWSIAANSVSASCACPARGLPQRAANGKEGAPVAPALASEPPSGRQRCQRLPHGLRTQELGFGEADHCLANGIAFGGIQCASLLQQCPRFAMSSQHETGTSMIGHRSGLFGAHPMFSE
jgi:hypothetical protein